MSTSRSHDSSSIITTPPTKRQKTPSGTIFFSARGASIDGPETALFKKTYPQFRLLSNFAGSVECDFMKDRFENPLIASTIERFASVNEAEFRNIFTQLYPSGNPDAWITQNPEILKWFPGKTSLPLSGILAKLCGGLWKIKADKGVPKMWKDRGEVLAKLAKVPYSEVQRIKSALSHEEKVQLMRQCLDKKYSQEPYRTILNLTGDAIRHERGKSKSGVPGKAFNDWTHPGGDLLGQLLMERRAHT